MVLTQEERRMACLSSNDEIQELLKLRDESNNLYEQTGLDREIQNALFVNKFYKGSEAHHFNCHLIHSPRKIAKVSLTKPTNLYCIQIVIQYNFSCFKMLYL